VDFVIFVAKMGPPVYGERMNGWVELYEAAFHVVNLPATLLLILVLLYWFTVMLGVLDLSSLDVDVDMPDMDMEADMGGSSPVGFDAFLEYFNIRYVPISIMISLFGLSFWVVSMIGNMYLNPAYIGIIGLAIFVGNVVVSAHVAKVLSIPFIPLFKSIRQEVSAKRNLVGSRVVVTSSKVDADFGQADIVDDGPPITLSVRTEGEEILKGTEAVILHHQPEKDLYIITTLEI
jgi:hypothetical protein